MTKLPITAVLVIYNGEASLERCLESCADLVSEIIVVHDGPCSDRSIEICQKFTTNITITPERIGVAEPNRVQTYARASNNWIFQLDQDEFLSDELRRNIAQYTQQDIVRGYEFLWPTFYKQRYYYAYHKLALFDKRFFYLIGCPSENTKPINSQVVIQRLNVLLEHKPYYDNLTFERFKSKWIAWAKLHAQYYLMEFNDILKFNCPLRDWEWKTRIRIQHPIIMGMIGSFVHQNVLGLWYGLRRRHFLFVKSGFLMGLYHVVLYYYVWRPQLISVTKTNSITLTRKLPITAVLVVYNEEKLIRRCLESCADLVDEIIIVHDGECHDRTLDICREFTDRIYVRPHIGEAEPHRVFTYQKANNDWIIQLDADEYLSEGLRNNLAHLTASSSVHGYECRWPTLYKGVYHFAYWKLMLFRKSKFYFIGAVSQCLQPINQHVVTQKVEYILEHRPLYDNITWERYKKKWAQWARIHAQYYLRDFQEIEKYNCSLTDWEWSTRVRIDHPILMGMIGSSAYHVIDAFRVAVRTRDPLFFKSGVFIGFYHVVLFYDVWKGRKAI